MLRIILLFICVVAFGIPALSIDILATSVRDSSIGEWTPDIPVRLFRATGDTSDVSSLTWTLVARNVTDPTGKIPVLVSGSDFPLGYYKIIFHTKAYFRAKDQTTFYPYMEVQFEKVASDVNQTMLVPLMMEGYGFNNYRGSLG